mgnify:CR=1 FL=1
MSQKELLSTTIKLLSETEKGIETTYTYDALGNLTEKVSSEGTTTYAYDALNQLTEVVNPDGTWQRNTYDASGIRSMIAENGVTTEFMTFNGLVLGGYNKDGVQTEHYYYGNSLLAAEYVAGDGNESVNANAEISLYYYLKNSHGDVLGLTDNTGTLTETYCYDAFGTLTNIQSLNESGVLTNTETALSRFLYAGEQYDTVIGRFTQEDTYLGDGRNLYVYVSNNPLKYVDPSGHCSKNPGYNTDRVNGLYFDMAAGADPEAYEQYKEEHKAWFDTWDFVENTTEYICESVIESMVESVGAKLDFASGFMDGVWSRFTQTLPDKNVHLVSEIEYDKGLITGNLAVMAGDTIATAASMAGAIAFGGVSAVATVGGGYVIVPEAIAATGALTGTAVYFANETRKDANRVSDSVEELVEDKKGTNTGNPVIDKMQNKVLNNEVTPPNKRGNAPISNKDGKPIEIHHNGQEPLGPFDEMHPSNHRYGENYKKNHFDYNGKSKIDRIKFREWKQEYWEQEWDNGRWND